MPLSTNYFKFGKTFAATEELKFSRLDSSHAYGLRFFGYLPQGEEQADMLSLIQKRGFTTSFVF